MKAPTAVFFTSIMYAHCHYHCIFYSLQSIYIAAFYRFSILFNEKSDILCQGIVAAYVD